MAREETHPAVLRVLTYAEALATRVRHERDHAPPGPVADALDNYAAALEESGELLREDANNAAG